MAKLGLALMMLFGVVHAQVETDVHTDEAAMIQISKGTEARHLGVTFSADEGLDDGVEGRAKCRSFQCPAGLVPKAMGFIATYHYVRMFNSWLDAFHKGANIFCL